MIFGKIWLGNPKYMIVPTKVFFSAILKISKFVNNTLTSRPPARKNELEACFFANV